MRTPFSLLLLTAVLVGCGDDGSTPDGGLDGSATCVADDDCDDGVFCNGAESCDPTAGGADARGCLRGEAPCVGDEVCDEEGARCATPCDIDDDMDDDGEPSILCGGLDCDDDDPSVFPGNTEICDAAGRDEDCDADTFGFRDQDSDGFPDATCCNGDTCGTDCNDLQANVHPGEAESCDGLDNDCNGAIDDGLASLSTWYPDCDGDLFGDSDGPTLEACARPPGTPDSCADSGVWVDDGTDCDDSRAGVNPSAPEICDGVDTDCNGSPDAPGEDDDGDGYGDASCGGPDCRDWNADINPGASELCDGTDSDCDGAGEDDDDDGFLAVGESCSGGDLDGLPRTDCDDSDPTEYAGADDICDGEDDDCDGMVDENASDFCFLDGAVSVCTAGACVFDSCNSGTMDCDGDPTNGCDDLDWSGAHCGGCTSPCPFACDGSGGCSDAIVQVDASYEHTCAVMSSGTVWCWGDNNDGELGDGTRELRSRPRRVSGLSDAVEVSIGSNHTCARHTDGTVSCWGSDRDGQLGVPSVTERSLVPVVVPGVSGVVDVEAGNGFTCALESGGRLCCWGRNDDEVVEPGGDSADRLTPVCRATDYVEIDAGQTFVCGMDAAGLLDCWGRDSFDQSSNAPAFALTTFALGHFHGCGVAASDGRLYCWGDNRERQIGAETSGDRFEEVALTGVVALAGGRWHSCAINGSGEVWCWGNTDAFGGTGGGTFGNPTPQMIGGLPAAAVEIDGSAGFGRDGHTCARLSNDQLWCWGENTEGQLGNGTTTTSSSPVQVLSER